MIDVLFYALCALGVGLIVFGWVQQRRLLSTNVTQEMPVMEAMGYAIKEQVAVTLICLGALIVVIGGLGLIGFPVTALF